MFVLILLFVDMESLYVVLELLGLLILMVDWRLFYRVIIRRRRIRILIRVIIIIINHYFFAVSFSSSFVALFTPLSLSHSHVKNH